MTVRNRSVLCVFLASMCFSTGGLFIKLVPWSPLAINGARNLIGAAVIGIYLMLFIMLQSFLILSRQMKFFQRNIQNYQIGKIFQN